MRRLDAHSVAYSTKISLFQLRLYICCWQGKHKSRHSPPLLFFAGDIELRIMFSSGFSLPASHPPVCHPKPLLNFSIAYILRH